jgi:hypothetical protein
MIGSSGGGVVLFVGGGVVLFVGGGVVLFVVGGGVVESVDGGVVLVGGVVPVEESGVGSFFFLGTFSAGSADALAMLAETVADSTSMTSGALAAGAALAAESSPPPEPAMANVAPKATTASAATMRI